MYVAFQSAASPLGWRAPDASRPSGTHGVIEQATGRPARALAAAQPVGDAKYLLILLAPIGDLSPGHRDLRGQVGDVLVAGAGETLVGPGDSAHQPGRDAGEQAHAGEQNRGQQRLRWHVVVRLAVGQRQGVQPLGPADREYLGDRTAGIVRDQIDVGQFERVAEAGDEPGQAWQ